MIVTGVHIIGVLTASGCGAAVVGAGVTVVAEEGGTGAAGAGHAGVSHGAGIAITAWNRIGEMLAALAWITTVICTCISIVAGEIAGTHADAIHTLVSAGAGVLVVTGCEVGRVDTALNRVTRVVGAGILVVAIQCS